LRSLDLCTRHERDLDDIEYCGIYKANLKTTEIIANYRVVGAESLFAKLISSRDLFTSAIYKTVEFVVFAMYVGSLGDSVT